MQNSHRGATWRRHFKRFKGDIAGCRSSPALLSALGRKSGSGIWARGRSYHSVDVLKRNNWQL